MSRKAAAATAAAVAEGREEKLVGVVAAAVATGGVHGRKKWGKGARGSSSSGWRRWHLRLDLSRHPRLTRSRSFLRLAKSRTRAIDTIDTRVIARRSLKTDTSRCCNLRLSINDHRRFFN